MPVREEEKHRPPTRSYGCRPRRWGGESRRGERGGGGQLGGVAGGPRPGPAAIKKWRRRGAAWPGGGMAEVKLAVLGGSGAGKSGK